jgi:hypothetical protein
MPDDAIQPGATAFTRTPVVTESGGLVDAPGRWLVGTNTADAGLRRSTWVLELVHELPPCVPTRDRGMTR